MFNFLKFLVKPHTPFEAGTILISTLQRKKIQFPLGVIQFLQGHAWMEAVEFQILGI